MMMTPISQAHKCTSLLQVGSELRAVCDCTRGCSVGLNCATCKAIYTMVREGFAHFKFFQCEGRYYTSAVASAMAPLQYDNPMLLHSTKD